MQKPRIGIMEDFQDQGREPVLHFVVGCCELEPLDLFDSPINNSSRNIKQAHRRRLSESYMKIMVHRFLLYVNTSVLEQFSTEFPIRLSCPRCRREYEITLQDYEQAKREYEAARATRK